MTQRVSQSKPKAENSTGRQTGRRRASAWKLTVWLEAVRRAVKAIPRGETASYARVAMMAGKPGAARAVVRALHALKGVPWWRVIRSDGTIAPQIAGKQRPKLVAEGVVVKGCRVVQRAP